MNNFAEFFSEEAIIRELARERLKRADRRGKRLFYRRIAPLPERLLDDRHEGDMLFPPRRLWKRFRPRDRQGKSAQALNLIALTRATSCLRGEMPHAAWVAQLSSTVTEIRSRALGAASFEFAPPCIIPCEKDPGKNRFRPLAQFRLKDKIIEVLTARYLRHALDGALLASCLAFRVGEKGARPPSIHSALNSIMAMNRRHRKRGLWVAECDIRAFFDCVGHEVAQRSLHELIADRCRQIKDLHVDKRALEIFTAYLAAYSFSDNVLSAAPRLLRGRPKGAEFPWPAEDLRKLGYGNDLSRIGVPQGGAISCLIANAVLHAADKRLNRLDQPHHHFRYMRYCDDMIVLAQRKRDCTRAFTAYVAEMRILRLPVHLPASHGRYAGASKRKYWEGKSRSPYRWHRPGSDADRIPWVQFVGYQVRWDGLVRIRCKSLRKHVQKLLSEADALLRHIRKPESKELRNEIVRTRRSIEHRFVHHMLSLSVGRRQMWTPVSELMPMCWANGFKGLGNKTIIGSQLKSLDRMRERQVQRVRRALAALGDKNLSRRSQTTKRLSYFGAPFSYYGQFLPRRRRQGKNKGGSPKQPGNPPSLTRRTPTCPAP